MRWIHSATAALLLMILAAPGQAQRPFAIDVRGGATLPTEDLGAIDLDRGIGFGVTASARVMPHAMIYAGWSWSGLDAKDAVPGADTHIVDTGYAAGVMFQHPLFRSIDGWVRAGALYNHIEVEDDDGEQLADSGHETGWEAGGGLSIPLGETLALTPGARFRTYSARLAMDDGTMNVDLSYVTVDIGLTWAFGRRSLMTAAR